MTDAKVISMDGDRPRQPGVRSVLLGADRASGERARRRRTTTPLLGVRAPENDGAEIETGSDEHGSSENRLAENGLAENGLGGTARGASKRAPAKRAANGTAANGTAANGTAANSTAANSTTAKRAAAKGAAGKSAAVKGPAAKGATATSAAVKNPVAKQTPAKAPAKQAAAEQTAAEQVAIKQAPAKQVPAKRASAGQAPAKQAPAKRASAEQAPAKQGPAKRAEQAPAKRAPAEQVPAKQAPAKRAPAKRAPGKQASVQQAPAKRASAEQGPVKQASAKQSPAKQASVEPGSAQQGPPNPAQKAPAKVAAAAKQPAKRPAAKLTAAHSPQPPHLVPVEKLERAQRVRVVEPGDTADLGTEPWAAQPGLSESQPDESLPAGGQHSIAKALLAQVGEALVEALLSRARPAEIEAKVAAVLGFLGRRLTGDYELDDFGFDAEFAEAVPLLLLRPLYRHWFRVEVRGIENLPTTGGALIVANHSGAIPMDALMTSVAVHEEHPERRFLRTLGADLVFQTPFLAGLARRSGATLASNPDAERLLSDGHLVGVWPEGFKGIGKPFTERYKLQRFGRGGFVSAALRTGTPIVPCSIVGAEEIYPIIGNVPSLARLLGLPYLPVTPFFPLLGPLGAIPLPSKWLIEFGEPVHTDEYDRGAAEDPMLVFDLTDQIRQSIQQTLYSLLVQRRSIFF
jgi:1-acyl-sn-glycerol-3-phosphate acyltransferase